MPTLADIYEIQAEECLRAAAKADDPQRRALMLSLERAAKGCRSIETRREIAARKCPAKGKSIWALTRFEWGQTSVELYEPQSLQRTMRG